MGVADAALLGAKLALAVAMVYTAYQFIKITYNNFLVRNLPGPKGLPLVYNGLQFARNVTRLTDWFTDMTKAHGNTWCFTLPTTPPFVGTVDVKNVEWMLKTNFKNYEKGPEFHRVRLPARPLRATLASHPFAHARRSAHRRSSPSFSARAFSMPTATCGIASARYDGAPLARPLPRPGY